MKKSKTRLVCEEWGINFGLVVAIYLMYRFIDKQGLIDVVWRALPDREAGLLSGMLLGVKDFEGQFYNDLKEVGLVHLVVASGANVALITRMVTEKLAGWLGRKRAVVLGLAAVWGYARMVGWEAPIIRAAILISIFYWGQLLGRKYNVLRGLGLAIIVMMVANFDYVTSVSFWLSVVAFGAIAIRNNEGQGKMWLVDDLKTTGWVSLWVSPILAKVFGEFSLVGPMIGAFCLFLVEYISVVGGVGVLVGLVWPFGGRLILMFLYPFLKYLVMVSEGVGSWSWITVDLNFNWYLLAGWYVVLLYVLLRRVNENKNPAFI